MIHHTSPSGARRREAFDFRTLSALASNHEPAASAGRKQRRSSMRPIPAPNTAAGPHSPGCEAAESDYGPTHSLDTVWCLPGQASAAHLHHSIPGFRASQQWTDLRDAMGLEE